MEQLITLKQCFPRTKLERYFTFPAPCSSDTLLSQLDLLERYFTFSAHWLWKQLRKIDLNCPIFYPLYVAILIPAQHISINSKLPSNCIGLCTSRHFLEHIVSSCTYSTPLAFFFLASLAFISSLQTIS